MLQHRDHHRRGESQYRKQTGKFAAVLQGFYLFGAVAIMFLGSGSQAIRPD